MALSRSDVSRISGIFDDAKFEDLTHPDAGARLTRILDKICRELTKDRQDIADVNEEVTNISVFENNYTEGLLDYVVSGIASGTPSGLSLDISQGEAFIGGQLTSVGYSAHVYSPNLWTVDEIGSDGIVTHTEYAYYWLIPASPASGLRIQVVQTDASSIVGVFDRRNQEPILKTVHESPLSWRKILAEQLIENDDYPAGTAVKKFNGAYRYAANNGIIWYFSNLGLYFLAEKMPAAVKTYLDCYIANLLNDYSAQDVAVDVNFKLDVNTTTGDPDPPRPPDSHDSYAATFLMLACRYVRLNNDWAWLNLTNARFSETNLQTLLNIATNNITTQVKTQAWCIANGFAYDYPSGHNTLLVSVFQEGVRDQDSLSMDVGFTADNSECYRGLKDLGDMLTDLGDTANATSILNFAASIGTALHGLYDVVRRIWVWNDTLIDWVPANTWTANASTVGTAYYPDLFGGIFAELWQVPSGGGDLYDETRFNDGYERLCLYAPSWWSRVDFDSFPNCFLGYLAAARRKDVLKGAAMLGKLQKYYVDASRTPGSTPTGLSGPTAGYALMSEIGFAVGIQDTLVYSDALIRAATVEVGPSSLPNVVLTGDDGQGLQVKNGKLYHVIQPTECYVDTNGTAVTRVAGNLFETDGSWSGTICAIPADGKWLTWNYYIIDHVVDVSNLVLRTSVGVQSSVPLICRAGLTAFQLRSLVISPQGQPPEALAGQPYAGLVLKDSAYAGFRMETTGDQYGPAWWMGNTKTTDGARWCGYVGVDDWFGVFNVLGQYQIELDTYEGGMPFFTLDKSLKCAIGMGWNIPSHTLDVAGEGHIRGYLHTPFVNIESPVWTDLAIDANDNTKMTSAANPLGPWLPPYRQISITGGTGFTPQTVTINTIENPAEVATADGGYITALSISQAGSDYQVDDVVAIADGTGGTAKVLTIGTTGEVLTLSLLTGGTGYQFEVGDHATTGGNGSALRVGTTVRYSSIWRAKCSAVLGTVGSTGGTGFLVGSGIYFGGYLGMDIDPDTSDLRIQKGVTFRDLDPTAIPFADQTGVLASDPIKFFFTQTPTHGHSCDTSGVDVTRVHGYGQLWPTGGWWTGAKIIINNVDYIIDHVIDGTHLVLTTSAGTQTGVPWCVPRGPAEFAADRTLVIGDVGVTNPQQWADLPLVQIYLRGGDYSGIHMVSIGDQYGTSINLDSMGGAIHQAWCIYDGIDDFRGTIDVSGCFFVGTSESMGAPDHANRDAHYSDWMPGRDIVLLISSDTYKIGIGRNWCEAKFQFDVGGKGDIYGRHSVMSPIMAIDVPTWTDLEIDAVDATWASSQILPLGAWLIGQTIAITAGTGFTVQEVTVLQVEEQQWVNLYGGGGIHYISKATVEAGGSGYTLYDVVDVVGGTGGQLLCDGVSAGVVTSVSVYAPGRGYDTYGPTSINIATTGGHGTGLKVNLATAQRCRAKFSASLGTLSSTGGQGYQKGAGLYFGTWPYLYPFLVKETNDLRCYANLTLKDASNNWKNLYAGRLELTDGIYIGGYLKLSFTSTPYRWYDDLLLEDSGNNYRALDCGLVKIAGTTVVDGSRNVTGASLNVTGNYYPVINGSRVGNLASLYLDSYGAYEIGDQLADAWTAITALQSAMSNKADVGHTHPYSTTSDSGGSPAHTHGVSGTTS